MPLDRRLPRALAILAALMVPVVPGGPLLAGEAENQLLLSYVGDWRGSGQLTGGESPEDFNCRMTVTGSRQGKINYAGRCSVVGTNLSVAGTIAYVDSAGRYEAAMTTNAKFSGLAVGRRSGNSLVFDLRERDRDAEGNDVTLTSQVRLAGNGITVQFNAVFNETGDSWKATVPFSRS